MMTDEVFVKSGKHLPAPLRDFHDQKDVFKTMHELMLVEKNEYAKGVSWVAGQCYVIDLFLWFMARRGWTLQRSRKKVAFRDLSKDVEYVRQVNAEAFKALLASRPSHGGKET